MIAGRRETTMVLSSLRLKNGTDIKPASANSSFFFRVKAFSARSRSSNAFSLTNFLVAIIH